VSVCLCVCVSVDHHVFSDTSMIPKDKGTLLHFYITVRLKLLIDYGFMLNVR